MSANVDERAVAELNDDVLLSRLVRLARDERRTGAAIVLHLQEVERRELHLAMGYSSIYAYSR